jgi:protein CpxP
MKKVIVAVLLVVGMTTFAQERGEKRERLSPEQKVELQAKKMKLDLDLNDKQTADIKKIVAEQVKKREAKRAEFEAKRAKDAKPTQEEMFQNKSQMLDEQIAMKAEMKKILNAEQFSKWEKIQAERSENKKDMTKKMHSKKRR